MTDATLSAPPPEDVAQRLSDFERTQDPATLWPGLDEPARVAAARELERVTRRVLAGSTAVALDPDDVHSAYALGIAAHTTGMGPVIGRWLDDGILVARPDVRFVFDEHLTQSRRRAARMQREALPALDALIDAGITPIVVKGFHTCRAYYAESGVRRMADLDLVIPPNQVADAEQALLAAGFIPDGEAIKPYKRDWVASGIDHRLFSVELTHECSKWVLELHASLDRSYHLGAVARLDGERDRVEPITIAGRELRVLSPALLVVFLACHCSQELDGVRLLRLFEIVRVVRTERAAGRFRWDDALAVMARTNSARYAFPALALAEDLAPGTVDRRVLGICARASTRAARHTVARLVPAGGSLDDRGVLRQLMWTSSTVSVLQRVLRNVWPAAFTKPSHVIPGWRVRLRRFRGGRMSLRAPDERA